MPCLALPCSLEDRENTHADKCKGFTNDWIYGTSCTLTSFPVLDSLSEHYNRSIFVAQRVSQSLCEGNDMWNGRY